MPLLASLLLLAAQEPPGGEGPRGSSQASTGERRIDLVARAAIGSGDRIEVSATGLAAGDTVEVTALENGRTILALGSPGHGAAPVLSTRSATALGISEGAGVRVRLAVATPQEAGALARGEAAPARIDAPPSLLVALRKRLPGEAAPAAAPMKPVARPSATAKPRPSRPSAPVLTRGRRFAVQVAALASAERARTLADAVGGTVTSVGALHRVRIGPLPDRASAERARARAASLGYAQATIVPLD
jgi:rare lipoprotein A